MHFNYSLPKQHEILIKNDSEDFLQFHSKEDFLSLYAAYFSTSDPFHIIILELIACVGLFIAICGYRFLRLAMFCCGFILAFSAFYILSPKFIKTKYCCSSDGIEGVHIGSSALVGIIVGFFVARLYRVGVFFIGKSLGLLAGIVLLQTPLGDYFRSNVTLGLLLAFLAITFGSLASRFEKSLVITATSLLGSYAALSGVDVFLKSSFLFAVFGFIIYFKEILRAEMHSKWHLETASLPHLYLKVNWLDKVCLSMFGVWLALSTVCYFIQLKITAKDLEGGGPICPFDFKACICGCCKKDKKEEPQEKTETVYLFTNKDDYSFYERRRK